ncbi:MAG: hypothetical protein ACNA8W_22130 [Bradymonadaceae bacterium]
MSTLHAHHFIEAGGQARPEGPFRARPRVIFVRFRPDEGRRER